MKAPGPAARKRWRFRSNLRILVRRPLVFMRVYKWPLAILLIGSLLDAVTTYRNLRLSGPEAEVHPAWRIFTQIFGVTPVTVAIGKALQAGCAVFVGSLWRRWCGVLLTLAGILYTLGAISNYFHILRW